MELYELDESRQQRQRCASAGDSVYESAAESLQRDVPQIPSSRWMKYFGLPRISHISRSSPKVSKGKGRERVKESEVSKPAFQSFVLARKPSTTLRSSPQQTQDHRQQRRSVLDREEEPSSSPSELLHAALKEPVLYESGFSVLRTIPVPHDQKYQEFYSQPDGVQQQVIETLKQKLGVGAASNSRVEYVMGRVNHRAESEPTILICCTDRQQRQVLNTYFKTHTWTMTGFSYSVEIDPVVLASGGVHLKPLRGNVVRAHDPANCETLCGLAGKVFVENRSDASNSGNPAHPMARLTLGGLICVGHRSLYALTTAHPFSEGSKSESDNTSNNTTSSDHVLFGSVYEFEYLDCDASQGAERKSPSSNRAWDWALLQVDRPAYYKPNSFHPQLPNIPPVFIESHLTAEELSAGEVWVCSASKGPRLAMLYADRTLMMIENSIFEARSIGLAEELADGDSGSWVVRDGKLCGYIYSRVLHRPWAYMLLIDSVFQEIGRVLSHTSDEIVSVEVATRAEVERLRPRELPPGNSNAAGDGEDVFANSTAVLASTPSDKSNVAASGSDPPKNEPGRSKDSEGFKGLESVFKPSDAENGFTSGPDPLNSRRGLSTVIRDDQNSISSFKASDANTVPENGANFLDSQKRLSTIILEDQGSPSASKPSDANTVPENGANFLDSQKRLSTIILEDKGSPSAPKPSDANTVPEYDVKFLDSQVSTVILEDQGSLSASKPSDANTVPENGANFLDSQVSTLILEDQGSLSAFKPSGANNVRKSGLDPLDSKHELPTITRDGQDPISASKPSVAKIASTSGPDPFNSEHKQSRVHPADRDLISISKPSDIRTTPVTGSDPPKTQDKVPEDKKDKEYVNTDLKTNTGNISSGTVANEIDKLKAAEIARKSGMDMILPKLIHFLNTSSDQNYRYHTTEDSRVTERVRQLFQRLQIQTTTFRESVRIVVTRHGDATIFILLKGSSERRLPSQLDSNVGELITGNLIRALGIPRTELLFKILASIYKRLHSLLDDANPIVEMFQKNHLVRILLRLNYRTKLSKFEEYLNGLEMSIKHLQWMLSEQAVYQGVQEAYVNSSSPSSSELQSELHKTLLQICTGLESIDPVVGLTLPYPTIGAYSIIPLESRQTVSFFCRPRQVPINYLWNRLHWGLRDKNGYPHWQRWKMDSIGGSIEASVEADVVSWWSYNGRPKNGSDGLLTTSGGLNTLGRILAGPKRRPVPRGIKINSVNSAPEMIFDRIRKTPGTVMMNMERYFAQLNNQLYARGSQHFMGTPSSEISEFALKLSYSIILLSSTPWVQSNWTWDNILAIREGENSPSPGEIHVAIVQKLQQPDEDISQAFRWAKANSHKLRPEAVIERLGFALIDLAFGKKLDASAHDRNDDDTIYAMATRLCDTGQIATRAGQIYEDVVKACLTHSYRSGSEIKTISPSRPDFQVAAYEAILSPLHDLAFPGERGEMSQPAPTTTPVTTRTKQASDTLHQRFRSPRRQNFRW